MITDTHTHTLVSCHDRMLEHELTAPAPTPAAAQAEHLTHCSSVQGRKKVIDLIIRTHITLLSDRLKKKEKRASTAISFIHSFIRSFTRSLIHLSSEESDRTSGNCCRADELCSLSSPPPPPPLSFLVGEEMMMVMRQQWQQQSSKVDARRTVCCLLSGSCSVSLLRGFTFSSSSLHSTPLISIFPLGRQAASSPMFTTTARCVLQLARLRSPH